MYRVCLPFTAYALLGWWNMVKTKEVVEPTNIVLLSGDDLGKGMDQQLWCAGLITPTIDARSKSGMQFNNVYSMPQVRLTRNSPLNGQYPV